MKTRSFVSVCGRRFSHLVVAGCLAVLFCASVAGAQDKVSITGHALDYTPSETGDYVGIPGVLVVARSGNVVLEADNKITDATGEYVIKDVPVGKTQIEFRRDGYINDPTIVAIDAAAGTPAVADAYLMPSQPEDPGYYARLAEKMWNAALASDNKTKSFRAEWDKLYGFGLNPAAKIELSKALGENAGAVEAVPIIADYQRLDPMLLQRAQEQFAAARMDPAKLPRPESIRGVPKPIGADVFILLLQKPNVSAEQRAAALEAFSRSWGRDYAEIVNEKSAPRVMVHNKLNGKSTLKFEFPPDAIRPR